MAAEQDFKLPVYVYYEDTDAGGVVYYANYLKFMERARTRWLHGLGFDQQRLLLEHIAFAVRKVEVEYHAPARLGDELVVSVKVIEQRKTALLFEQQVLRGEQRLVSGAVQVVCVDTEKFRPRVMPGALLKIL